LKMKLIGNPETSVSNPKYGRIHFNRGGSLRFCTCGELLNVIGNKLRITRGLLREHCHIYIYIYIYIYIHKLMLVGVIDANRNLKWPRVFFVTVGHWQY
jgi:hypothetical protein